MKRIAIAVILILLAATTLGAATTKEEEKDAQAERAARTIADAGRHSGAACAEGEQAGRSS
ncbi:MAG TPA: hypothetical protein VEO74_06330 [Thermoanaerobaculia bacterium]|nr:hypothetical protein [Thermoanaerobaculia bacterium]